MLLRKPSIQVVQSFGAALLGDWDDSGVFPQLGACADVGGALEQDVKHDP